MRARYQIAAALLLAASAAFAQPPIGGSTGEARTIRGSATLPATCTERQVYQDTNSGGTETYVCTATNTWTKLGEDGGGGGVTDGDKGDVVVSGSGATWTVESGTASALAPAVVIEGATADAFEGNFTFADPTADWTWNWAAAGAMRGPDGTSALPTYGFASDPNTGIYLAGADTLSMTAGGVDALYVLNNLLSSNVNISSWEAIRLGAAKKLSWSDVANPANNFDTGLIRSASGVVGVNDALHLTPMDSPPRTCDATAEGDLYYDTSHALCVCDASAWGKVFGAGTCA